MNRERSLASYSPWGRREWDTTERLPLSLSYIHISHTFFIYSSVDRHLGCFPVLAITYNAAMNINVHISFLISVFIYFRKTPSSGTTGSYGSSIFNFLSKLHTVFQYLYQFTFPPTVPKGSRFSTPWPTFMICCLSDNSHSDRCEVTPHCGFDLHLGKRAFIRDVKEGVVRRLPNCIKHLQEYLVRIHRSQHLSSFA